MFEGMWLKLLKYHICDERWIEYIKIHNLYITNKGLENEFVLHEAILSTEIKQIK